MTATVDQKTTLVSQLINSCYKAENGYRSAADSVEDATLKRLFEIYAQQRIRFAEELREYLPETAEDLDQQPSLTSTAGSTAVAGDRQASLKRCLEMDARN